MESFLSSVAAAYLDNEAGEINSYCFVFPNKRAGVFFHHAMAGEMRKRGLYGMQPDSCTIAEFVEELSPGIQADRLEAIFLLYQAYCEAVMKKCGVKAAADGEAAKMPAEIDFDKFQRWADTLLADFNDVDMAMADTAQLFPNIVELNEIVSTYLTEAQIEAINRYWSSCQIPEKEKVTALWRHIVYPLSDKGRRHGAGMRFISLWRVLQDVYNIFRKNLAAKGLHYMGMAYRHLADTLGDASWRDFTARRYVFVGFSMLTEAEKRIFAHLRDMSNPDGTPMADFYWDTASPAFKEQGNTASFILKLSKEYPSIYPEAVPDAKGFPKIRIIGVPSRVGQAKLTGELVGELVPITLRGVPEDMEEEILRQTAIVLPEETLAVPTLRSLPPVVTPVNITMGYKLRQTSVATLVSSVITMQLRGRMASADGQPKYLAEDVLTVLSHPVVRQAAPELASLLTLDIKLRRSFTVSTDIFGKKEYETFAPLFRYVTNRRDPKAVIDYLTRLIDWTLEKLKARIADDNTEPAVEIDIDGSEVEVTPESDTVPVVDLASARRYREALRHLSRMSNRYLGEAGIYMSDATVFRLIEKLVAGETISFKGQPLRGVQLMGVLEARALDFKNIFITSMNENAFPRRYYQRSLIPPVIRKAFGLQTTEHHEAVYSYYFYRMIARAKNVWLIYDARRGANNAGQMSRYLHQLMRIYRPQGMTMSLKGYDITVSEPQSIEVEKTPEILARIERYFDLDSPGKKYLSASSINDYINCPLSFYIKHIEGYGEDRNVNDWIDEAVYGSVMHKVLERSYAHMTGIAPHMAGNMLVKKQAIEALLRSPVLIDGFITEAINELYLNLGQGVKAPLTGTALLVGRLIKENVVSTLIYDMNKFGDFVYCGSEVELMGPMLFESVDSQTGEYSSISVNFKAFIDRIDRVPSMCLPGGPKKKGEPDLRTLLPPDMTRIVDYKTGSDEVELSCIDEMFDTPADPRKHRAKAVLQLFMYAQALHSLESRKPLPEPVALEIYRFRDLFKGYREFRPVKIGGAVVNNYLDFVDAVNGRLIEVLEELRSPDTPFSAAKNVQACKYCQFSDLCGRKRK